MTQYITQRHFYISYARYNNKKKKTPFVEHAFCLKTKSYLLTPNKNIVAKNGDGVALSLLHISELNRPLLFCLVHGAMQPTQEMHEHPYLWDEKAD